MDIKPDTLLEKSDIKEKMLIGAEDQSAVELPIQKKRIHKKNK